MTAKTFVTIKTVYTQRVEQFPDGKLGNPELIQVFSYVDKKAGIQSKGIARTQQMLQEPTEEYL